mgnify:FL=1
MGIKETLLSFMKEEAYRPMDIQELVSVFDISPDEYKVFKKTLKIMELEGSIVRTNKDKFAVPERLGLIKGRIQSHKKGFGFLSIDTRFSKEKITRQTKGYIKNISDSLNECIGIKVFGYEIHNGTTTIKNKEQIFIENENGDILGTFNKNVIGTYLHGIFDDNNFLNSFINKLMINKGINILDKELMNYKKYKLTQYDELTKLFEENIDLNRIFNK